MANFYATYAKGSTSTVTGNVAITSPIGQQVMANSVSVAIASDQSAVPVTGTITATNPSVSATGAAVPADATYAGMNVGGNLTGLPGTANGLKVDGSAVTQPVSGTVTANQGTSPWVTNVSQFGGSNVVTGLGVSGAGIPRVTVSSDTIISAAQSGTWLVTANQGTSPWVTSTNLTQIAGNGVQTGTGTGGSGVQRVTVSSDSTIGLVAGTAIVGKVGIDQTTPGTTNAVSATNFPTTVDTNTGLVGSSTPRMVEGGRSATTVLANNNYGSNNVTTSAYVQLIASTSVALNKIFLWNISGSIIKVATGGAGVEVDKIYVGPGGTVVVDINIPASTRVSLEALDTTASTGYFLFMGLQ